MTAGSNASAWQPTTRQSVIAPMDEVADIPIPRGGNEPAARWDLVAEDGNPLSLSGAEFVLTVRRLGRLLLVKETGQGQGSGFVADVGTSSLTWTPTLDESRLIPLGRVADYEIERRANGRQRAILRGFFVGTFGSSSD